MLQVVDERRHSGELKKLQDAPPDIEPLMEEVDAPLPPPAIEPLPLGENAEDNASHLSDDSLLSQLLQMQEHPEVDLCQMDCPVQAAAGPDLAVPAPPVAAIGPPAGAGEVRRAPQVRDPAPAPAAEAPELENGFFGIFRITAKQPGTVGGGAYGEPRVCFTRKTPRPDASAS